MKSVVPLLAIFVVLVIVFAIIGWSVFSSSSHTSSTTTRSSLGTIPSPKGYLGAKYQSSGNSYQLSPIAGTPSPSNASANIPASATNGYFMFVFSNSTYSQNALSVTFESCSDATATTTTYDILTTHTQSITTTSIRSGEVNSLVQKCSTRQSLSFSYDGNSQGQFIVTTNNMTIPCSNSSNEGGTTTIPSHYILMQFGVNTSGRTSATPYYFNYIVYANC